MMINILCLASGSQSRKKVLERADVNFVVQPPQGDEIYDGETPKEYVQKLSRQKADEIAGLSSHLESYSLIVAADSVVVLGDRIIEKPKDRADAIQILSTLQGATHRFLTGLTVIDTSQSKTITRLETTDVTFTPVTSKVIERYVDHFQPYAFAGGYDNGISSWFIQSIQGSQSNLMGLPMTLLREMLGILDYELFDFIHH